MPAFDPVRDAVLNSPLERSPTLYRRATHLSVLLNAPVDQDALGGLEPLRRSSMDINHISPPPAIPYNPTKRLTKPTSVLTPLTQEETLRFRNSRGEGVARLTGKRKRAPSDEPEPVEKRPQKRHAGDVSVVVEHCKS